MVEELYFDTYAIIEVIETNPDYEKLFSRPIITSKLNMGELYLHHLRKFNKLTADHWHKQLNIKLLDFDIEDVYEAMILKFNNSKLKLSMVDCIGYTLAKKNKMKFLTGDTGFKKMKNVLFIK